MAEGIVSRRDGDVAVVTLSRAEPGNRLTNAMAAALTEALDAADDARVIVLGARGDDFCLGRDIAPPVPGAGVNAMDVLRDDAAPILALYAALRRRRQPLVGVVRGRAWGIGCVLAAVCDYTLAAADSSFALRELERGIPPCIAMTPLLDRMPVKALGRLVYSAAALDAAWALQVGIVSQVVAPEQLDAEADAAVARLLGFADPALHAVKQYLGSAPRFDETNAALYGASLLANVLGSR